MIDFNYETEEKCEKKIVDSYNGFDIYLMDNNLDTMLKIDVGDITVGAFNKDRLLREFRKVMREKARKK